MKIVILAALIISLFLIFSFGAGPNSEEEVWISHKVNCTGNDSITYAVDQNNNSYVKYRSTCWGIIKQVRNSSGVRK